MAKKRSTKKATARTATKKSAKNSLVGNINKRKKAGSSRSKQNSTISDKAYADMKKGWKE